MVRIGQRLETQVLADIVTRFDETLNHVVGTFIVESTLVLVDDDCPRANLYRLIETFVYPENDN